MLQAPTFDGLSFDPFALLDDGLCSALGSFATGVTGVTTATEDQMPVGVTASSFKSVLLDPPLVLRSLAKKSMSLGAFQDSGHFAVHVLSFTQENSISDW